MATERSGSRAVVPRVADQGAFCAQSEMLVKTSTGVAARRAAQRPGPLPSLRPPWGEATTVRAQEGFGTGV
jgi:hypothetical protein